MRERLIAGVLLAVIAAAFAWLNGGERVVVNLGLVRLRGVPLPVLVFAAFLAGMLTLFLASLKAEMRTQRMLERYRDMLGPHSRSRTTAPAEGNPDSPDRSPRGDGGPRPADRSGPAPDEV